MTVIRRQQPAPQRGTTRFRHEPPPQAGFLPWLMPGVLAAGALVALMAFKSGRAR